MPKTKAPRLTEAELRKEVTVLLSQANEVTKPNLSIFGLSRFEVQVEHLLLELSFTIGPSTAENIVEVTFFNDELGDRVKRLAWEDTLGLMIEVAGASFTLVGPIADHNAYWRSVILEGLPIEEWPEAKFRLLSKE